MHIHYVSEIGKLTTNRPNKPTKRCETLAPINEVWREYNHRTASGVQIDITLGHRQFGDFSAASGIPTLDGLGVLGVRLQNHKWPLCCRCARIRGAVLKDTPLLPTWSWDEASYIQRTIKRQLRRP